MVRTFSFISTDPTPGPIYLSAPFSPTIGIWYHLAVTRSGGGTYKFYVNGAQIGSDQIDATEIPAAITPLTLGKAEAIPSL